MNYKLIQNPRDLPGFRKKSFAMYFRGGEIWFEHLDGIYEYEALVLEKLRNDLPMFTKPSTTSLICFDFDETVITENIRLSVIEALTKTDKHFTRVCFVSVDKKSKKVLKRSLYNHGFEIEFIYDFEKAKEWLVSENCGR